MDESATPTFVGIDIGGTNTRLGIVDGRGRILADRACATPTTGDGEDLILWLDRAYRTCRDETDSYPPPVSMGVAVPGILEPGRSAVIRAVNLPFLEGLPLRDRLVAATGVATIVDCDTVAGAWGEFCARERKPRRMAYLTVGTGVGAAIILDGEVVRHTHHSAGHLGHLPCDSAEDAPICRCGRRGCLEARIGGRALHEAAEACGFEGGIAELEVGFQEHTPAAVRFVNDFAPYVAVALLDIATVYDTDLVVLGGGVSANFPSLFRQAAELVSATDCAFVPEGFRVEFGGLGDYSGLVGAALLAAEHTRANPPPT